jgi:hypothetical protein
MVENTLLQPATLVQLETRSPYDLQEIQSPRLESAMPPLVTNADSHGWIMGRSAAYSSRFPKAQYSSNAFSYADQAGLEVNDASTMSSSDASSFFSLYDASSASGSFGSNKVEPDTFYTSPLERRVAPSSMGVSPTAPALQGSFNNATLWHEMGQNSSSIDPGDMVLPYTYDGLPNVPSALWSTQSGTSSTWSKQIAPQGTISPQALSLMAPSSSPIPDDSSPISNSGWLSETSVISQAFQESVSDMPHVTVQSVRSKRAQAQTSDGDMLHSAVRPATSQGFGASQSTWDIAHPTSQSTKSKEFQLQRSSDDRPHPTTLSVTSEASNIDGSAGDMPRRSAESITSQGFQTQQSVGAVQHPNGRVLRPRRKLPSGRMSEIHVPPFSSNAGVLSRSHKRIGLARSRIHSGRPDDAESNPFITRQYPRKISSMQRPLGSEKRETKITEKQISDITIESPKRVATSPGTQDTALQRIAKDKFLLDSKREGKSYKQIRMEGGFTEAESTLRGRHRTLIKKPEERVRKPEWESNDVKSSTVYVTNLKTANALDSYAFSKRLSTSLLGIPAYRDRRRYLGRKFLTISSKMAALIVLAIRHVGRSGVSFLLNLVIKICLE